MVYFKSNQKRNIFKEKNAFYAVVNSNNIH